MVILDYDRRKPGIDRGIGEQNVYGALRKFFVTMLGQEGGLVQIVQLHHMTDVND